MITPAPISSNTTRSPLDIVLEHTQGRRKPLRGIEAVNLARALGLPWELTGTGLKPGTLLKSRAHIRMPRAGTCRKCISEVSAGKSRCGYCHFDFTQKLRRDESQAIDTGLRWLVMESGSIEKVEVDEGHVFKAAAKPTKKERNRLKRKARAA